MRKSIAAVLVAAWASAGAARPPALPILFDTSGVYEPIGGNVALLKLADPDEQGIAVFAFPSALGLSGLFGARLPGVLPVIETPWPIPNTPNVAVGSLIASNAEGMVAYRSQIQFQVENSIVIAGPIRGPMNTGTVRVIPVWSFVDVSDPAIDHAGNVYFGARGDDGLSRLWVIWAEANGPQVFASEWNFLETILSVSMDSSCMMNTPGATCTLAVLFDREVGPAMPRFVWAMDLFLDVAPVTAGPFSPMIRSLDAVHGEVSVVECEPDATGPGRVLTVIAHYGVLDPPRVTAEAFVNGANVNRGQNFCGVRTLPHYPGDECPDPTGHTDGAAFMVGQGREAGAWYPLGVSQQTRPLNTNPRAINNRGDVAFSVTNPDGSSALLHHRALRTSCPGDSDADLLVTFTDITTTLANWGTAFPPDGFCVPLGDSDFDRRVTFGDITMTLSRWGENCR